MNLEMTNYKRMLKEFYNFQRNNDIPTIDLTDIDEFESYLEDCQRVDEEYVLNMLDDTIMDFDNDDINGMLDDIKGDFFYGKEIDDEYSLFITAAYKKRRFLVHAYIETECTSYGVGGLNDPESHYKPKSIEFKISVNNVMEV